MIVPDVSNSSTGTTSSSLCSADLRSNIAAVGGCGSVDWIVSLARIRESRLSLLEVASLGRFDDWSFAAEGFGNENDFCALMAPAFRSSSRRWPLASKGVSFARDEHVDIGSKAREAMNSIADWAGALVSHVIHCRLTS